MESKGIAVPVKSNVVAGQSRDSYDHDDYIDDGYDDMMVAMMILLLCWYDGHMHNDVSPVTCDFATIPNRLQVMTIVTSALVSSPLDMKVSLFSLLHFHLGANYHT